MNQLVRYQEYSTLVGETGPTFRIHYVFFYCSLGHVDLKCAGFYLENPKKYLEHIKYPLYSN